MVINGKTYTLSELLEKVPKYDMFFKEKVVPGSHQDTLDKDPIATTYPNLHMRFDPSRLVVRGDKEIADRKYTFLGQVGTKIYSCRQRFFHDEEDTTSSETP